MSGGWRGARDRIAGAALLAGGLALAASGCGSCGASGDTNGPTGVGPRGSVASSTTSPTTSAVAQPVPANPGPAYLGTIGGVTKIEGGAVATVGGVDESISDLIKGPKDTVYASSPSVFTIRGDRAEPTTIISSSLRVGPDGTLYWPGLEPMVEMDRGGEREDWPFPEGIYHVVADASGQVWAAGESQTFYRREGATWVKTDLDGTAPPDARLLGLEADGAGRVYAIFEEGILRKAPKGGWAKLPLSHGRVLSYGRPSSEGALPLLTDAGLVVLGREGEAPLSYEVMGVDKGEAEGVGVDDAGRRWVGTPDGLAIFDAEGKRLMHFPPGSLPGPVHALAIFREGPQLPSAPPPIVRGTIEGRLLKGDEPLANVPVEICHEPTFVGFVSLPETPCSDHALRLTATTEADGSFRFENAPRHEYLLAYEGEQDGKKKWAVALGWGERGTCCGSLGDGAVEDVGDLRLR